MGGNGDENRYGTDRVDNGKKDDEGCYIINHGPAPENTGDPGDRTAVSVLSLYPLFGSGCIDSIRNIENGRQNNNDTIDQRDKGIGTENSGVL